MSVNSLLLKHRLQRQHLSSRTLYGENTQRLIFIIYALSMFDSLMARVVGGRARLPGTMVYHCDPYRLQEGKVYLYS